MAKSTQRPIIIKKIVKKAHGHHGGSWKVAYADFVTAMMAFFMVMWILGLSEDTRKAIEGYFATAPVGLKQGYASGASPISVGTGPAVGRGQTIRLVGRSQEEAAFRALAQKIQTELEGPDGLGKVAAQIEMVITEEGLRIELIEAEDGETFFAFGSAVLKPAASKALRVIASQLESANSSIVVEGHTDAVQFGSVGYSNWELSSDRAQAARRQLQSAGIAPARITHIRGYADRKLRNEADPNDPSNRRTSILLPFSTESREVEGGLEPAGAPAPARAPGA